MVPVIGPIPAQQMSDEYDDTVTFTKPHEIIAITSILPVSRESVCRSELTDDTHLAVYAVSTQPATESPTQVTIGAQSPSNDSTAEEPYAGFNTQIQQILSEADTLHNEADRQGLKKALHKYKDSFAKDSLDCGLTNIHTVRIPTNPNAPPTFVRQYKIPIASYEPVQEIVDSMLEKGIIRPVTFLNGQRIRDGVVTNARIATWLMTLQGRDVEARYLQILTWKRASSLPKLFNGHAAHTSGT